MENDDEGESVVLRCMESVCSSGINGITLPGPEICRLDPDNPGPLPQAQGCAAEGTGDHRADHAHDGGTDRWKTVAGGHVPRREGAGQYLVAGKAVQEMFQFCDGSTLLYNGDVALLGKEQIARGGPWFAATNEAWMCGSWDSCRGRQYDSCGRSRAACVVEQRADA